VREALLYSLSHRFLFIHIPKTAGNSLQSVLSQYSDDAIVRSAPHHDGVERFAVRSTRYNTRKHSTLTVYAHEYGDALLRQLFTFCCVRNPWDRCISHFLHRERHRWDRAEFMRFVAARVKPVRHYIESRPDESQPLSDCIEPLGFVMRFESLQDDFDRVCERLDIPLAPLPHRNVSGKSGYAKYYDSALADFVGTRFHEEIEYFGYSLT